MSGSRKLPPDGLTLNASLLSPAKVSLYVRGFRSLLSTSFEVGSARQRDIIDSTFRTQNWNLSSTSLLRTQVAGNVSNDRIERSVHPFHILIRHFDSKLVLDLVEQFSQVKVGIRLANIVIRSHTLPAITELFNADLANPDWDVLGEATAVVPSPVEG